MMIVFIIIPLIASGWGAYLTSIDIIDGEYEDLGKSIGNEVSNHINSYITEIESSLKLISHISKADRLVNNPEYEGEIIDNFNRFIKSYNVSNIYLGTTDGKFYHIPETETPEDFDCRERVWYKGAMKNKDISWSDPYIDVRTKETMIAVSVPVYDNTNNIIGVMGIDVPINRFSDTIKNIKIGEKGFAIIYDSKGKVMAHKDKANVGKTSNSKELLVAIKENKSLVDYEIRENGNMEKQYAVINNLEKLNWKVVSNIYASEVSQEARGILNSTLIIGLITIIVGAVVAYLFARSITNPINTLVKNMEKLEDGDFNVKCKVKNGDEIGKLSESFNNMVDKLSNLIIHVKKVSSEVTNSAQLLASTSEENSASASQISRAIEEIAKGATEQAQDTEKGVQIVSILSDKLVELSNNSETMMKSAENIMKTSELSAGLVKELETKTKESNESTNRIEGAILSLDKKINYIEEILQTIDSISDQTNLLALNASIEAARAGKYGKGFAVVAEEIRTLSYDSKKLSDEIKEVILDVEGESRNTIKAMNGVKEITKEQTESVFEVSKSFDIISNIIKEITKKIESIDNYVHSMSQDKEEIVFSMENISAVSEEAAAASEEVSASIEEQTSSIEEVAKSSSKLNDLANILNKEINVFKI
ncbi:methyl-accepting chemotaxis sensory transducer with cache sensor Mcp [Gottschalkia purinilytica]|uniref:Methyl-accepting chemotaxis sensory transducer with cache sensor Mcp n=1 Tax=Gottschalkia purinilytica TaxID=1503 RepID=A0A0L0WDQ3_GOTPU|nr:methyl-accepting chemotaxis sensory transducer with cache sensor Mcp [Gottschalkia purinilytica]